MIRLFAALALLLLPAVAYAQPKQVVTTCGSVTFGSGDGANGTLDTTGLACVNAKAPYGTYADGSVATSTSAATVFTANTSRVRIKLLNTDYPTASGGLGIAIWCRWGTSGAAPASAHGVGSFPVLPGGGIDDQGAGVNRSAVNCIAESGAPILFAEQY